MISGKKEKKIGDVFFTFNIAGLQLAVSTPLLISIAPVGQSSPRTSGNFPFSLPSQAYQWERLPIGASSKTYYHLLLISFTHILICSPFIKGFPCGLAGKESACKWETWVHFLGWEDPLEKGKTTHSSILAWRIPWTV